MLTNQDDQFVSLMIYLCSRRALVTCFTMSARDPHLVYRRLSCQGQDEKVACATTSPPLIITFVSW